MILEPTVVVLAGNVVFCVFALIRPPALREIPVLTNFRAPRNLDYLFPSIRQFLGRKRSPEEIDF